MVRLFLIIFFVWFFLEGVFRKWIFDNINKYIFLIKYFILLVPIFVVVSRKNYMNKRAYSFFPLIILYFFWCVLEFNNNKLTDILPVKLLGFLVHLFFISLIFIVPPVLNSKTKLLKFLNYFAYISLPIFIVGIIQYLSPHDSIINKYVSDSQQFATVSGNPRVTGVFSYITPYTAYLEYVILIFVFLIITTAKKNRFRIFLSLIFILGITNLLMTGSRKPLFLLVIKLLILVVFLIFQSRIKTQKTFIILIFLSVFVLSFVNFSKIGSESFGAIKERIRTNTDISSRVKDNYDFKYYSNKSGIIGYGLGTAYQGSSFFIDNYKDMPYVESENSRLIIEFGLIGFIIVFFLRISIIYYSIKVYLRTKDSTLKLLTVFLILYQFPVVIMFSNITYNYAANIIYWFTVSMVICINNINNSNTQFRRIQNN